MITETFSFQNFYQLVGWSPYKVTNIELLQKHLDHNGIECDIFEKEYGYAVHRKPMEDLLSRIGKKAFQEIQPYFEFSSMLFNTAGYNLVTNEGETEYLNRGWNGGTFTDYVFLTDGTPSVAETDTLSSHAGWTEVTAYSEANRQDLVPGTAASQSIDSSGSPASFSINSDNTTIGGAGTATDNTKGGTTGILLSVAAAGGGDQTLSSGSTLDITITGTAS